MYTWKEDSKIQVISDSIFIVIIIIIIIIIIIVLVVFW